MCFNCVCGPVSISLTAQIELACRGSLAGGVGVGPRDQTQMLRSAASAFTPEPPHTDFFNSFNPLSTVVYNLSYILLNFCKYFAETFKCAQEIFVGNSYNVFRMSYEVSLLLFLLLIKIGDHHQLLLKCLGEFTSEAIWS